MRASVALAVAAGIVLLTGAALARPADLALFKQVYNPPAGSKVATAGCLLCHDKAPFTKTGLNPYGKDLAKQGSPLKPASFKAVEALDSDKDGFANLKEIQAGTLPGDPASKPAR
ncbi:MAG: hypothetical protein QN141_03725 [Armatimonadota bacterium]|nr:hypothetical protein [Armatimonadota bacterium]MDR7451454.1 hypothetical protein [Armatimonadota bacterium]MDR7466396.1 hypothetical protein [Armatimonadota bacterium]MDR7493118.1 hypothetical protein [Armatimonadota bacterium]MDR7498125.1 hypothetical protein [Armatimonadota bacterium]